MEATNPQSSEAPRYIFIASAVLVSCFILFSIDKDTHSFTDLLRPGNLAVLVVYFFPAFATSSLLYRIVRRTRNWLDSLTMSVFVGIPVSFIITITVMAKLLGRI
jgi:hypothetical protein